MSDVSLFNSNLFVGFLGAFSALGGVIISSYYASKNNDKKINFDLIDRDRERKFNLRKEIYLEAVDSIVEFEALLGGVAIATDLDEFNAFHREQTKKLKKLELISDMDISLKVNELSVHFRDLIDYILVEKIPLISEQDDLDQMIQKFNDIEKEIDGFIGSANSTASNNVQKNTSKKLLELQKQRDQLGKEITFKIGIVSAKQQKLGMKIIDSFDNISELIGIIYTGFRNDFGLDSFDKTKHDLTNILKIRNKTHKRYNDVMQNFR